MKVETPQIAWHNRDRVTSVSIQPKPYPNPTRSGGCRIATGGDDSHVVIWEFATSESGKIEPICICDITRHQSGVNAVRWSPDGTMLASSDTESGIWVWKYSDNEAAPDLFGGDSNEDNVANEENWVPVTTLRGHLQDVIGLSWSPCSQFIVSCATDSTAIVFDVKKGAKVKMLDDHKGWVNGVCWDPLNKYIASISSDRTLRVYNTKNYKNQSRTHKATLPIQVEDRIEQKNLRLFHDDTFQHFFRRLDSSPDGELLVIPSGVLEVEGEANIKHCTYVFTRKNLTQPVLYLPSKEISIAVKFSPIRYNLRPVPRSDGTEVEDGKPWTQYQTMFALPYRQVFAVATKNTVVFYDTQQPEPFARVSKIHYISLNDLAWSPDGTMLIVASTDGFCSVIKFKPDEIGTPYSEEENDNQNETFNESTLESMEEHLTEEDPQNPEDNDHPGDLDNNELIEDLVDDVPVSKEGIPLNKEGVCSPAEIKIRSVKEGGRPNPRRLQLITISSPKSKNGREDVDKIDENDLNLILEDTVTDPVVAKHEKNEEVQENAENQQKTPNKEKKRVPFVTLSSK